MKVLDTNMLTHLFERHPKVLDRYSREAEEVTTTAINRAEMLLGRLAMLVQAASGQALQRGQRLLDLTDMFLASIGRIVPGDRAAADQFDRLLQNKKLRKIGLRDLGIAAITLAHRATLVTRNLKDFRQVPGLRVENWMD
jgi:tRNA(fMet)-specific endonuclease VapC